MGIAQTVAHAAGESIVFVRMATRLFPSDFGGGLVIITRHEMYTQDRS